MPTRTYMVVDRRHDHSFRIPRPDLSVKLGTPNACNDCHADKSPEWTASAIERWHGPNRKGFQNYAAGLRAAWTGQADAATLLAEIAADRQAPAIARASALTELGSRVSPSNIDLARSGLTDPDPMVRIGALDMLEGVPMAQRWPLASPLLSDAVQGVRIRAAFVLAGVAETQLPRAIASASSELRRSSSRRQKLNADRPEARSMLGSFHARRGAIADAETEYKAALRLSPTIHARSNQPRRSLPPPWAGSRRRERSSRRGGCSSTRCGSSPRARLGVGAAQAARRGAWRIAPRRRTGA